MTRGMGQGTTDHPDPPQHQPATNKDVTATLGDDATFAPSKIRWETTNFDGTTPLISWLTAHPADCHVLFSNNKKRHNMTISTDHSSGRIKADIHLVIAKHIFEDNPVYGAQYAVAGNQPKFGHAVANQLT
ncbi:uncharacterized protein BJ212DRAFT_1479901 [Suillus subaureus]|uniref:Uncharacterized protein n=1 Tax=Suillus subaureus TaxID=48587 RepID=A0A9P7EDN7_9AGAM|nr:uncharacterized protein BJ212DRAFT_1479901 [Suillus subaureus]KAG1818072.1 hypothetical protein BJ212DRAFT_1479901 [Suillus subaureus]